MSVLITFGLGLLVAFTVAATGIGGGVLLMPFLLLVLHIPLAVGVETSLLFMAVTKLWAVLLHWHQHTVDFRLALSLSTGSVPGALLGSEELRILGHRMGPNLSHLLTYIIAVSVIAVASLSFVMDVLKARQTPLPTTGQNRSLGHPLWIGFVGGLVVSITSVGSGSLIILLLLLFCPRSPSVLVGTDIFHGMILTATAGVAQLSASSINLSLLVILALGAVPGVYLGIKMSLFLSPRWLRRSVLLLALAGGFSML